MFFRTHLGIFTFFAVAIAVGAFWGTQAAAEASPVGNPGRLVTMTDIRHPVERYFVPPFVRDLPAAFAALGLTIYPEDRVTMRPDISYGLGGELYIERALPIQVQDGSTLETYRTWQDTVDTVLAEQRVELGDRDRVSPDITTRLSDNLIITITRVAIVEVTKHESVPFARKTVEDPNRPRGEERVTQRGENGTKALIYSVTRENGVEISRKLVRTEITQEAIPEIVSIGTRVITLGQGKATWYDPPWSGMTAAHNSLPKGTMVDVVSISTGKRVTVKINDRGIQGSAVIDLSIEAFQALAPLGAGVIQVRLEVAG